MTEATLDLIRRLEVASAAAWPAAEVEEVDGWLLRFTGGSTRRANSVLPVGDGRALPLPERLALVERFYARRGAPARFQMSPAALPADLDEALDRRGYVRGKSAQVLSTPLAVLASGPTDPATYTVAVESVPDEAWFATYCAAEEVRGDDIPARRDILRRITAPAGFARVERDGRAVAVGLGVLDRDWVGLFCMATRPECRRQGAATAALLGLAGWAQRRGANQAYLQVLGDNTPALRLYARSGFQPLYAYHYRERPGTLPG